MDWIQAERRSDPTTIEGRIYAGLRAIIERRRATPHIHGANPVSILDFGLDGVFAYARRSPVGALVCVFNFSERWRSIPLATLEAAGVTEWRDRLANVTVDLRDGALPFPPQGRIWLT
jgi:amylosucrase